MEIQHHYLYILQFKDEPLVKIGISRNPSSRFSELGETRFNYAKSYLVRAKSEAIINMLEKTRQSRGRLFRGHQDEPVP